MIKDYAIEDIKLDEIKHADIDKFEFDAEKKHFVINFCHVGLKSGIFLYDCTINIADWWDLEVIERGKRVYKKYRADEVPTDIDQIFKYEYDGQQLTLFACGSLDRDAVIYYKFIKPKLKITGEYDPD